MTYKIVKFIAPPVLAMAQCCTELRKHPDSTYSELFSIFQKNFYDRPWTKYLQAKGVDTFIIVPNISILQKKWAEEHDLIGLSSLLDITREQISAFDPDIILFEDTESFCTRSFRDQIKKFISHDVKYVGWRSSANIDFKQYSDMDLVLTSLPDLVDSFKCYKIPAVLISDGFNPEKLTLNSKKSPDIDFSFIGTMGLPHGSFSNRVNLILALLGTTPLEVWSDYSFQLSNQRRKWKNLVKYWCYDHLQSAPFIERILLPILNKNSRFNYENLISYYKIGDRYRERIHDSIYGNGYYEILSRSKLTLNCHIDIAGVHSVNIRLFDATGMGACLLTEEKKEITKFFEPGEEVVCYTSFEDCKKKVNELLKNPDYAQEIAKNGQKRTLKDHTYEQRTDLIHKYLTQLLSEGV